MYPDNVLKLVRQFAYAVMDQYPGLKDYHQTRTLPNAKNTPQTCEFLLKIGTQANLAKLKWAWRDIQAEQERPCEGFLRLTNIYLEANPELKTLHDPALRTEENAQLLAGHFPYLADSLI
jgi:hypothetical protein